MVNNVAIVEDDNGDAERLEKFLQAFAKERGVAFSVRRFHDAEQFLKDYRAVYSIVFMDIQMPGLNGVEAATRLRKTDKAVSLIFITSAIQYAQAGYEVDALSFLLKPVGYHDICMKVQKALDLFYVNKAHSFVIELPDGMCTVSTDELLYVEVSGHKIKYHLASGEILGMSGSLSKAEEQLKGYGFLRCNACYLVNAKHVLGVRGLDLQLGSEVLRISRPRRKQFMIELTDWFAGGAGK